MRSAKHGVFLQGFRPVFRISHRHAIYLLSNKAVFDTLPRMKHHALFVGVDEYADPTIRNLRFSIPNATN